MSRKRTSYKINIPALLFLIVLMSAVLIASYHLLKKSIDNSEKKYSTELIKSVLPPCDEILFDSAQTFDELIFYAAMKGDSIIGYACKTFTEKGFNGRFDLLVGFLPDGTIYKSIVFDQNETPGFGDRIQTSWKEQFDGKNLSGFKLQLKNDSGDVDALSGSTISSKAYCDAIEKAYSSLMKNILEKEIKIAGADDDFKIEDINAFKTVLPAFDNDPLKDILIFSGLDFYLAKKKKDTVGYAVKSSARGYNGSIWILAGILPDGKIYNISILQNNETPGYGSRLSEPKFLLQFKGNDISKTRFEVKQDGGDVDAISGSTISSRGFCEALALACSTFSDNVLTKDKTETIKDSVEAPSKPQVFQFTDKSVFNGIIPAFDNNPLEDFKSIDGLDVYFGKSGGSITGLAITSYSNKGYNGKIIVLTGFTATGTIQNTSVLLQNETEYMGTLIAEPEFKDQFTGKNPSGFKLQVKDDGGDVDAISGSTISSRAFCDAVQKAYTAYLKAMKK